MSEYPSAKTIKKNALLAATLNLVDGLPENMQALFERIYPRGIAGLSEEALEGAYELARRSAVKVATRGGS
jgi:hypothetical protein